MGIDRGRRAVFLDRDGVINRSIVREGKPFAPATLAELEVLPGVPEALGRLRAAGYLLIVVTNQPDVARGLQLRDTVEAMHAHLSSTLPLDAIRTCFDADDASACRKPNPGLLVDAAVDFGVDLSRSVMVGDRWRDIEAGERAGCRTVFVDRGYRERRPERPDAVVGSLGEAAEWILLQGSEIT